MYCNIVKIDKTLFYVYDYKFIFIDYLHLSIINIILILI